MWISVHIGSSAEIWRVLTRCGEIWRDVGFRTGMASAAPSVGLSRDQILFHAVFIIFVINADFSGFRKTRRDVARCGEIWRDVGFRT